MDPVAHLGLVHLVARRLARVNPAPVTLDELVSAGSIGLLGACATFDASRGCTFSTFAMPRIRGAMLDELRRIRRAREITLPREQLEGLPDARPLAVDLCVDDDARARVRTAVAALPPREQTIVVQRYWHAQTLRAIGATLGVSEARASQLHTAALHRLRTALDAAGPSLAA